jgi:hypothetical protein
MISVGETVWASTLWMAFETQLAALYAGIRTLIVG